MKTREATRGIIFDGYRCYRIRFVEKLFNRIVVYCMLCRYVKCIHSCAISVKTKQFISSYLCAIYWNVKLIYRRLPADLKRHKKSCAQKNIGRGVCHVNNNNNNYRRVTMLWWRGKDVDAFIRTIYQFHARIVILFLQIHSKTFEGSYSILSLKDNLSICRDMYIWVYFFIAPRY